jgi:beta-galactosidase
MTTSRRTFLKTGLAGMSLALGPTGINAENLGSAEDHNSISANLQELVGKIRLGAEFFLNQTATEESVRKHFRLMQSYGFTVARIFIIWDDVERSPGVWNFERYDWIYDGARDSGVKIAATLCSEDPPGWMDLTPFYHRRMNLNDPQLRIRAAGYIQKVVGRYRNHPAQGPWLLMNEPTLDYNFEPSTMEVFGKWLEAKYGTVEKLNERWFRPLQKFSEVQLSPVQWDGSWVDYISFIDWKEFNIDNLVQELRWIHDQVGKLDPVHPTHLNVPGVTRNMAAAGSDFWLEGKTVDFLGASIYISEYPKNELGDLFAYSVDMLAGAAGSKPWWVTEMQAGPTIYSGHGPLNPTPIDVTRWLWDVIGAGGKGALFWLWAPRVLGREAGEFSLVSLDGKPSDRLAAAKAVVDSIQQMPFLAEATPQPPGAGILYNRESMLLLDLEGRMRNRTQEAVSSLIGCYSALRRSQVLAQFLDLGELKYGRGRGYPIIYLPYSYAIDDKAVEAIRDYVEGGGTVWADGLLAWKNEYGIIRPNLPGGLSDVFGWESFVTDVDPVTEPYSVTASGEMGGELWRVPLALHGAEVLVRDRESRPFATRHSFGKGTAIYWGAAVTLCYFQRHNPVVRKWIAGPAIEANSTSLIQMEKASEQVGFRALHHPSGPLAILTNWGQDDRFIARFGNEYASVTDLLTNVPVKVTRRERNTYAESTLPSGQVCVLRANK